MTRKMNQKGGGRPSKYSVRKPRDVRQAKCFYKLRREREKEQQRL